MESADAMDASAPDACALQEPAAPMEAGGAGVSGVETGALQTLDNADLSEPQAATAPPPAAEAAPMELDGEIELDSEDSESESEDGAAVGGVAAAPEEADAGIASARDARTKNELLLQDLGPPPPIDVVLPSGAQLVSVGTVASTLESLVVVRSHPNAVALDMDSVLWLPDRAPLGQVFEVFGPVREPFYIVRFASEADIAARQIVPGIEVLYAPEVPQATRYVLPATLHTKGTDASWTNDEEPPPEEAEYSDDDDEAAARARRKGASAGAAQPPSPRGGTAPRSAYPPSPAGAAAFAAPAWPGAAPHGVATASAPHFGTPVSYGAAYASGYPPAYAVAASFPPGPGPAAPAAAHGAGAVAAGMTLMAAMADYASDED